ncbi:MAG: PHP domain-containing protein [Ktedonobacteraceae bacterium]
MKIETDFHTHIVRSSAIQMVQRAQEKGLRVLGLSEHVFQMREARPFLPHMPQDGPFLTLDEYFTSILAVKEQVHFDVRIGMEVDFVPDKHAIISQAMAGQSWDFLIGSVHEVDGLLFEWSHPQAREEGEALWRRYFELLRQAVASGSFSLVSHPVRMRAVNPFLLANLDEELEQLAAEATRCDVALEINGYDVLTYPSLVKRLARACALHQTPISVGSDAHDPRGIAQGHQLSEEILHEAGLRRVRTWQNMLAEEYTLS